MGERFYDDLGRMVLRLTLGCLLLFHGFAKLGDGGSLKWIGSQLASAGLPEFIAYGVYVGEIVAPLMIIAGVYCRIGGLLVFVSMLFAVLLAHSPELLSLSEHGGWALELQGFYAFGGVVIALLGSGRFAIKPD